MVGLGFFVVVTLVCWLLAAAVLAERGLFLCEGSGFAGFSCFLALIEVFIGCFCLESCSVFIFSN